LPNGFQDFRRRVLGKAVEIQSALDQALSLTGEDERFQFRTRVNEYRVLTRVQRGRAGTWGDWDLAPPVWARVDHGELYIGSDATEGWPSPSQTNLDFPTFYNAHLVIVSGSSRPVMWQYGDPLEPLATVRNPLPIPLFLARRLYEIERKLSNVEEAARLANRLACLIFHVTNMPRYIRAFRERSSDPLIYFKDLYSDTVEQVKLAQPRTSISG